MTKYLRCAVRRSRSPRRPRRRPDGPDHPRGQERQRHVRALEAPALKCETCHATAAGGKIEGFGKEKAHATCVECHKKEAKGPSKCADCHKKA